ncbi:ligase-associated DNA damage response exonuclease [Legionella jordanis]|uniref:Beta-lactamase superfamily domain protein n=1 Tax=Legionella jordanis TaxID=456 RepID=A0A0W0VDU6_9GAMM|nr:ligase-associated DNA damage response exonuclease [Legionella jordanis]KTD18309.1 Beta-lactamase superfamily domain protein [Legionella jordanis]RMX05227.1 ligase-associated DNA damage response exonuclease [Legionella jordanis]RMX20922.1 ligase-associated DNA damage response exonuclease [Legionella jordanis]VEH13346.1 F0F1-type ATP synthase, epsilon subunit (mitochondrial delta subunit) [Legionella jordanis]HAT8713689.1 ligase-associated DNA damage response exonuclease [Legionella jordanis]
MLKAHQWFAIKSEGLYCIPGDFYIDPLSPVHTAIISHAHSDHGRPGHKKILATRESLAIMRLRYGENCFEQGQSLPYRQPLTINQVQISFLPAGHVLGSAQIVMDYLGNRVIYSGDYKRRFDPTCTEFETMPCDVFISEATFALPIFVQPAIEDELAKLFQSLNDFPIGHLIAVYPLGKCQRLIKSLRLLNYTEPIYLHGALIKMCELYESLGIELGDLRPANVLNAKESAGKIILCPPNALHDRWTRRFGEVIKAYASGWMQIRARAKQKNVDLPLIISDHADWPQLLQTIDDIAPQEIWITHGLEEALVYQTQRKGYRAKALHLLGYEEDED